MTDDKKKEKEKLSEQFRNTIKDVRGSSYSRRVGTRDRDAYTSYIHEAYAAGYLDDEELGKRTDKITQAKYAGDLNDLVSDLPSYAELRSVEMPVKVRKWALGTMVKAHKGWASLALLIVSLLTAIMPSVVIGNMFGSLHRPIVFPFDAIMVVTIIFGAIGSLTGIFGMIIVADSSDDF